MTDRRPFTPDFKNPTDGGIGKPKKKRGVSQQFIDKKEETRARKLKCGDGCRICPNRDGYRIEPHHIVRRGAPHFGTWNPRNILGLCLACHTGYHNGDDTIKRRIRVALTRDEVDFAEDFAYQGFVDDVYWPLPKDGAGQTVVACEVVCISPSPADCSRCCGDINACPGNPTHETGIGGQ